MKYFDDNLITFTVSITADHLGLAIEALYRLKIADHRSKNAFSVILHGYCALESAVNLIGYEMFWNQNSEKFIPEEKRDMPLKRMVKSWNASLPCIEKIDYIFSVKKATLPNKLKNELIELNNLRNWLTYGFSYQSTWLIEPNKDDENSGTIVDYEYNIDWKTKFPNTKFNLLNELNDKDAVKALRIIWQTLKQISIISEQPFHLFKYMNSPNYKIIHKDTDIEEILRVAEPNKKHEKENS